MVTKVITIKKKGGGTRRQAVQVLKSGKFKFIKNTAANLKGKVKRTAAKVKSKTRKRSKSRNTNKKPAGSRRSMKGGLKLYSKSPVKKIAAKTAIGVAIGLGIRLVTMFNPNRDVRELGSRAANIGSSYGGGGTGNLAYQGVDFALSRVIPRMVNGSGASSSGFLTGGA